MIAQHENNWAQDITSAWKILATDIFPVRKKKKMASSLLSERNFTSKEKCIQFLKRSIFPAFSHYFAFLGTNNSTTFYPTIFASR